LKAEIFWLDQSQVLLGFDFGFAEALKACALTVSLRVSSPSPRFDASPRPLANPDRAINFSSTLIPSSKRLSQFEVDGQIAGGMAGIFEAALGCAYQGI